MTKVKSQKNFTEGKIFTQLLLFILPIMATNLLQVLYNAADMMVVSLSHEVNAVGAIGTTSSFLHLVVNLFIGFSVGANVVVARAIGANDRESAQKAVHTSLLMAVMFGMVSSLLGILLSKPILTAIGNTGNLLDLSVKYARIYLLGVPFLALTKYLSAIFRAKGDAKTPLLVLSVAGIANVLLNMFFVLVLGMSVEGVAIATMSANVLSFAVLLWKLAKAKDFTTFSVKYFAMDKASFKEIVRIGLPAGIQSALFSLSNILIQSSIVSVNNSIVPAESTYQPIVNGNAAASNIDSFIYTSMNAVHQGAVTFTGQNIGAEKPKRIKPILYNSFLLSLAVGILMSTAVWLVREPLLSLYNIPNGADSLQALAFWAANLRLLMVGGPYFLCGLMEACTGVLRGLGKSLLSTMISLFGSCLMRVLWLLIFFPMNPILEMVYVCYPITWFLTATVSYFTILRLLKNEYHV